MLYITLRQFEYIVGVADAGSLTNAARLLNVSQPSLSVAITRVERQLGAPIFLRGKGVSIEVTPYGHRIISKARTVLKLAADIEQEKEVSSTWSLGCFEDIAPWYLAPALKRLGDRFPDISFQGREGRFVDLASGLAEGRIDAAISYDVGFDGRFQRRMIREIAPVAFLPTEHPLARRPDVTLTELVRYPVILSSENLSEGFMRGLFARVGLTPVIRQRVASLELMRSLAAHGVGIGISYSRPPNDISYDGKRLVTVPINTPEAKTGISLIWSALRPARAAFDDILGVLAPR